MKVLFNVCCCHKYTFVVVREASALSLRKVQEKTKKVVEGCLPKAATKGGEIQQGANN